MKKIAIKIVTPKGIFLQEEIEIVTLKTTEGYIGLQYGKSPFIAALEIGKMFLGKPLNKVAAIAGGVVEVTRHKIHIITDAIEYREKIDLARAQRDKEKAEKIIKKEKNEEELLKAQISLAKAINRIRTKKE